MKLMVWSFVCGLALFARGVPAQDENPATLLELRFVPTDRAQIAVWVETKDGTFVDTLALTFATATAGIGNRPGAVQMNSGFRWPYGRREGVLPVWAHRRADAPGAKKWKRVIFQDRSSEGYASRTSNDSSVDDYYCLSFDEDAAGRDRLDAVSCASVFNSDKGRFITTSDRDENYAEPFEDERGDGSMRPLGLTSLYPPRRDVERCGPPCGWDHADVAKFQSHALDVMPRLDAISQATPPGQRKVRWQFGVPSKWSRSEDYVLYVEVNVEGDYDDAYNDELFPTPRSPGDRWDSWAVGYGYPYRGQPSVVYALAFRLDGPGDRATVSKPLGYGSIHGEDGKIRPLDDTIANDARRFPGSGADRLRLGNGVRATLEVQQVDPCALEDRPEECGLACDPAKPSTCGVLVCDEVTETCQSFCVATSPPSAVQKLEVAQHPNRKYAHTWAKVSFQVPRSERTIGAYEVQVKPEGGTWTDAFTHDSVEELLPVALDVCTDPGDGGNMCLGRKPGDVIEVDLAGLTQATRYTVSVAARDEECHQVGKVAYAEFETPVREFTTVSPCFIATAAFGSPLAREIGVLRAVRDRYLAPHALGRAIIAAYYAIGPSLAGVIREHSWLRDTARAMLSPLVTFSDWWMT